MNITHHRTQHTYPLLCGLMLMVAMALTSALAADWPTYMHDFDHSNFTTDVLTVPLRTAWQYRCAQPPSPAWPDTFQILNRTDFDYASHPVIANGILCFGSTSDDTVRALDAKTGEEKWHFVTGGPVRIAPQIDNGKVYFGADDGVAYCLDAATGKIIWTFNAAPADERMVGNHRMISRWPIRTGVLVSDGMAYFVAGILNMEGVFAYALNAETGKVIWCNDTLGFSTVTIVDYPENADPSKETVGGHNGEFAANAAIGSNPQGPMLLHGDMLLIPNANSGVTALDRRTGARMSGGGSGTWLTIDHDILYSYAMHREDTLRVVPTPLGTGAKGRNWGADDVPQVRVMPPRRLDQIHGKGKVSALVYDGNLYARYAYGLAMASGRKFPILLVGEDGAIIAQDPDTERVLWQAPVDGEAREIAVADGRAYVSTTSGMLYCFEPAQPGQQPSVLKHDPAPILPVEITATSPLPAQLAQTGMDRGFALMVGDTNGLTSTMLAATTHLRIVNVQTDAVAAQALRERLLAQTTWYGSRIHVQTVARLDRLPFSQFFANAVIVAGPVPGLAASELYRVLRPCGGVLLAPGLPATEATALMQATGAPAAEVAENRVTRGKLPGALDWDSDRKTLFADQRVKWPLRPLWYGGPSTEQVHGVNPGSGPVVANGRYYMQGEQTLTAVDAYNGEILWSRAIPKTTPGYTMTDGVIYETVDATNYTRTDLTRGVLANNDAVYLQLGKAYFHGTGGTIKLDARTGEQLNVAGTYHAPTPFSLQTPQTWPLDAEGRHFGDVAMAASERGLTLTLTTKDSLVTPEDAWELFFDFRPVESRYGLFERGAFSVRVVPARDKDTIAAWYPGTGVCPRLEVAGTRETTGTQTTVTLSWLEVQQLTGGKPAGFDFAITLDSFDDGKEEPLARHHLFGDWAADGLNNGWARISLDGTALSTDAITPPSLLMTAFPERRGQTSGIGDIVTPARDTPRIHPLTGDLEPKMFRVAGCLGLSQSAVLRSGSQSMYDFVDDSGMRPMGGVKARCSSPQIVAQGLLIISEENGHCVCNFPLRTTMVLAPAERRLNEDWAFFFARPADTYLRQAAINLGAPGDRRDENGILWLGYPRLPANKSLAFPHVAGKQTSLGANGVWMRILSAELQVPMTVECFGDNAYKPEEDAVNAQTWMSTWSPGRNRKAFGPYRVNADHIAIAGTDRPWLYASEYRGIRNITLPLNYLRPIISQSVNAMPAWSGKLDSSVWQGAPQARLPYTKTDIFVRHTADTLYLVARRPAIVGRLGTAIPWAKLTNGADAEVWKDDSFEVFLSDDTGKVVHMGVSASGARFDGLANGAPDRPEDSKWNCNWTSEVAADEKGLVVQMAIPWQTLADAGLHKERLGINMELNQKDISGEPARSPGMQYNSKSPNTAGEALCYLGITGRTHCLNFAPLGLGAVLTPAPRQFTVRLHFAELDDVKPGERVFDVKVQGQPVLKDFDIAKEAGVRTALVKEFHHILANDAITLEFVPKNAELTATTAPILNAFEVSEEGFQPKSMLQ